MRLDQSSFRVAWVWRGSARELLSQPSGMLNPPAVSETNEITGLLTLAQSKDDGYLTRDEALEQMEWSVLRVAAKTVCDGRLGARP